MMEIRLKIKVIAKKKKMINMNKRKKKIVHIILFNKPSFGESLNSKIIFPTTIKFIVCWNSDITYCQLNLSQNNLLNLT